MHICVDRVIDRNEGKVACGRPIQRLLKQRLCVSYLQKRHPFFGRPVDSRNMSQNNTCNQYSFIVLKQVIQIDMFMNIKCNVVYKMQAVGK